MDAQNDFDVIIVGTGLTESVVAAALSKAGHKVAHIDTDPYYGSTEASLTLDEYSEWLSRRPGSTKTEYALPQSRQYALSLAPAIIPSVGPLIQSLVASGVSRYGSFRLLERVAVYENGAVKPVPGSKEDVFKNKDLTLLDKRRLMRFLTFALGDFESSKELEGKAEIVFAEFLATEFKLNAEICRVVVFALAFCNNDKEPALPSLRRIRAHLKSAGRYGASPFLVGHYGGLGELAQGFCRSAAVNGAVYILGRPVQNIVLDNNVYHVTLEDLPDVLSAKVLVTSAVFKRPDLASRSIGPLPPNGKAPHSTARCLAVVGNPIKFGATNTDTDEEEDGAEPQTVDTSLIIFPPDSLPGGSTTTSARALMTGPGTMSSPAGHYVLYISLPLEDDTPTTAVEILEPYFLSVLQLTGESSALFVSYYIDRSTLHTPKDEFTDSNYIISPPPGNALSESGDSAARNAEAVFKVVSGVLGKEWSDSDESIWPPLADDADGDEQW